MGQPPTLNKQDIIWDDEQPINKAEIVWDKPATPVPTTGQVAMNAVPKGLANAANMPATFANILLHGLTPPFMRSPQLTEHIPNYPMKAAESLGLVNPAYEPQTGGQNILDTAIQGGIGAALTPTGGVGLLGKGIGLLKNAATGAAAGTAAEGTRQFMEKNQLPGGDFAAQAVGMATPFMLRSTANPEAAQANAVRDQTLKEAQAAGYKVPASTVNPSFFNNRMESIAGKAAVKQDLQLQNQGVTNELMRKELGIPPNTPITPGILDKLRDEASDVYRRIAAVSPRAASALDGLQKARFEAKQQWNYYNKSGKPEAREAAEASTRNAELYEKVIEKEARKAIPQPSEDFSWNNSAAFHEKGKAPTPTPEPPIIGELKKSRTLIAKTHDIERALNLGDADVDARILGAAYDKNPGRYTGNLKLVGAFQQGPGRNFVRESSAVPPPGVSGTDAGMAALLGTTGYGAGGNAWLAAGLPLARGPVRSAVTSDMYQRLFAQPDYGGIGLGDKGLQAALLANAIAQRQQGAQ